LTGFATTIRHRLPPALRDRTENLATGPLLAATAAVGIMVLAALGLGLRAGYRSLTAEDASAAVASPAEEQSDRAESPGPAEPAAPVREAKPPPAASDEATVLLDLGSSLILEKRPSDVPSLVARLIAREPEMKNDPRVHKLLFATAASDDRRVAAETYTLLTGPMGEAGAALLYEIASDSEVRKAVRARARAWLATKDFERLAPLSVYAAAKIEMAKSCEDKYALLDFAQRAGGKYVLKVLKDIEKKKACEPDDLDNCYPCMRNDGKLSDAIARIEGAK
jgi:hypothetical protein